MDTPNNPPDEIEQSLVELDAIEARILGSLIEKQATTPETYPLTLNAVVAACNQKSNREPTTNFETSAVGHALRQLEGKGLVTGTLTARASRYAHRFEVGYHVTSRHRTVLGLLLLRGPQTLNELFTRSERLADFANAEEMLSLLERLITRTPAMVVRLHRAPGQREDRYMHLLCGAVSMDAASTEPDLPARGSGGLGERVSQLETLVAQLQEVVEELKSKADGNNVQ